MCGTYIYVSNALLRVQTGHSITIRFTQCTSASPGQENTVLIRVDGLRLTVKLPAWATNSDYCWGGAAVLGGKPPPPPTLPVKQKGQE